jgi:hypothetical protein
MNKFYRRFICLILLVGIISGSVIYFTVDINTLTSLTAFKPWSIILAIVFVGIGLILDGSRLMHLVKISNEHITLSQAVQVVFGNYFLALLTPGATGGAVAQLMFLRHAGVPAGKATVLVIVRTLVSILFLLLCMPFIFLHDEGILPGVSNEILMFVSLVAFVGIVFIVWAFKTSFFDGLVIKSTKRFSNSKRKKCIAFYRDIKGAVTLLSSSPRSMFRVFIESGLSLIAIYSVVPCLLLGLGVELNWYTVMGRMIFLNMLLYFSPTPGGSGIAEGGFVLLFSETVPAGTVGIVAVFWRVIAEYIPFLIGFYYTIKVFGRDFINRQLTK